MAYEDYLSRLLETGGETTDVEGILAISDLLRKRELEQTLAGLGEQYGGYDIFSGARQKARADVLGRFAETGAAERANLLANVAREKEARRIQAAQLLSQIGEAQKGREFQAGESLQERRLRELLQGREFEEAGRGRTFQAGESALDRALREAMQGREFTQQTALQTGQQTFQAGESALDRALREAMQQAEFGQQTALQTGQQTWQTGESALDRALRESLQTGQQTWAAGESALDRALRESMQEAEFGQQAKGWKFQAGESALDRALREAMQKAEFGEAATQRTWQTGERIGGEESALARLLKQAELEAPYRGTWEQQENLAKYLGEQQRKSQTTSDLFGLGGQVLGSDWFSKLLGVGGTAATGGGLAGMGTAASLLPTTTAGLPASLSLTGAGATGAGGAGAATGAGASAGLAALLPAAGVLGGAYLLGRGLEKVLIPQNQRTPTQEERYQRFLEEISNWRNENPDVTKEQAQQYFKNWESYVGSPTWQEYWKQF